MPCSAGADIIVQAALGDVDWFGYADVLARVDRPSELGAWSHEVQDTKLARETRGGTILQLCVYTELVAAWQGVTPDVFRVVTPIAVETYRVADFAAYYRLVKRRFLEALDDEATCLAQVETAPSPTEHCEVCRWWLRCNAQRRKVDHVSFVANLGRAHEKELARQGVTSLAALARMPLPVAFKPERGAKATCEQLREQARLQLEQRESKQPTFELLPAEVRLRSGHAGRRPAPAISRPRGRKAARRRRPWSTSSGSDASMWPSGSTSGTGRSMTQKRRRSSSASWTRFERPSRRTPALTSITSRRTSPGRSSA